MKEITPLPWVSTTFHWPCQQEEYRGHAIVGADKRIIGRLLIADGEQTIQGNGRADAAYITMACNAYPQMREALEAAEVALRGPLGPYVEVLAKHATDDTVGIAWQKIQAALSAAKGAGNV